MGRGAEPRELHQQRRIDGAGGQHYILETVASGIATFDNLTVLSFLAEARSRGWRAPRIVGHANVLPRMQRYVETAGYNSKICYDINNRTTLIIWTNMAVSLDGQQPANTLMVNVLDQIYELSPLLAPKPGGETGSDK